MNFTLSINCFTETWLDDSIFTSTSLCNSSNYVSKHQVRNDFKGADVSIDIQKSLNFKIRNDLNVSNKDLESLSVEVLSEKESNASFSALYKPPYCQIHPFENFLTLVFSKTESSHKTVHIAGDFNLNLLDHDTRKKVLDYLSLIYENGMIPTTNKPTRVAKMTSAAVDHILANSFSAFSDRNFKTVISDHFPIYFIIPSLKRQIENETTYESIELFKQRLFETDWQKIEIYKNRDEAYKIFLHKFLASYDGSLPKKKMKVKIKDLQSSWTTKGFKKSSKRKERLYKKFLQKRNRKNELEYKYYKTLFKAVQKLSKKLHLSKLIPKYKNNIKKTWEVIKESTGKEKCSQ